MTDSTSYKGDKTDDTFRSQERQLAKLNPRKKTSERVCKTNLLQEYKIKG